jgi:hypothetical protein
VDIRFGESLPSNGHELLQELIVFISAGSRLTETEIQLVIKQGFILQLSVGVSLTLLDCVFIRSYRSPAPLGVVEMDECQHTRW